MSSSSSSADVPIVAAAAIAFKSLTSFNDKLEGCCVIDVGAMLLATDAEMLLKDNERFSVGEFPSIKRDLKLCGYSFKDPKKSNLFERYR